MNEHLIFEEGSFFSESSFSLASGLYVFTVRGEGEITAVWRQLRPEIELSVLTGIFQTSLRPVEAVKNGFGKGQAVGIRFERPVTILRHSVEDEGGILADVERQVCGCRLGRWSER